MGVFLIFVGLIVFLIGIISLIKPLRFLRITTRKMGAIVLVSAFVILMLGASLSPVEEQSVDEPAEVAIEEPETEEFAEEEPEISEPGEEEPEMP